MKVFEGKVNEKTFNDEQEFYKAAIAAMKDKSYDISSSYKTVPEPENGPNNIDTTVTIEKPESNADPKNPGTDKIKLEIFDSTALLAHSYDEIDSYIRGEEDKLDDWLVAFDESYENIDIDDILKQERIQRLNVEAFIKDYNTQREKIEKEYTRVNKERLAVYGKLQEQKERLEAHANDFSSWVLGCYDEDYNLSSLTDTRKTVIELRRELVRLDTECKRCTIELNYLSKVKGYIDIYKEYLKGVRDVIDIYSTKSLEDKPLNPDIERICKQLANSINSLDNDNIIKLLSSIATYY